jgi:uncharacterized membrane protein YbhN (UPF0104 family)
VRRPAWRQAAGRALRLAVSLALVAGVLWLAGAAEAGARIAAADPMWWLAAVGLLTGQTVLMAMRWRLTAARLGLRLGRKRAVGEYYLAQALNATLPGGVMGDAARAVRTRAQAGLTRAVQAVMIERLAGQTAIFAIATCGFALALARPGGIAWPAGTGAALAGAVGLAALALASMRPLGRRLAPVAGFARAARQALLARAAWPRQAALGLAIAGLNLLAFAACARATGTTLDAEAVVTIVPLILTAMLMPLSVAGWGWREGAAAALFPLAGASASAGVAAGLAFGAAFLATALPGFVLPALAGVTGRALPPPERGG